MSDALRHIRVLIAGNWQSSQVQCVRVPSARRVEPRVESAIESAWAEALARPGIHLFDGPMCRLESFQTTADQLELYLSTSTYKAFLGTNMSHPEFAVLFGPQVMANPVGVSAALLTADHRLLFGRRNGSVAYYPNRVHPFSGCMEPCDGSPFDTVCRELVEELSLLPGEIDDIRCIGIAQDVRLVQPEMIFAVRCGLTVADIQTRLDHAEHDGIVAIPAAATDLNSRLVEAHLLTPVAVATILLWGRLNIGASWYETMTAGNPAPGG